MVALLLMALLQAPVVAAVLWQTPTPIRVPNGETRTIALPAGARAARLVFRVRAHYWRPAGSNPLLRLEVSGREIGPRRDRRTSRVASAIRRDDGLDAFDFGRWRVPQGPAGGVELAIDVSDLLRADAPTVVAFTCAAAGTLGATPLVIEDLRLEAAPALPPMPAPPDWRTPRLGAPHVPRFDVEADAGEVRVSWRGRSRTIRTTVTGGPHGFARRIERFPTRVEVRDTITNGSAELVGLRIRHALATDATWVHLGGRLDPDIADAYSPWNPTVFTPVGDAGLGLVVEDDVFRQQLFVDFVEGDDATTGLRTDMLCLAPGTSVTLVWSIYPVATPSYWDFINTVRADWRVNRTVTGSFIWFTPDAILATPPDVLRAALARQGTAVAAMFGGWVDPMRKERPPLLGFGAGVLADEFARYRTRLRDAVARLKKARPDLRVLLYFDAQRESASDAIRRYADSLLVGLDGTPERVDWAGRFSPSVGMVPTARNGFGRALGEVARAMRGLGADGLYWDEMDGVDYRAPRVTTNVWDGHSCALGDDGAVGAKLGLVNLVSEAAKLGYAETGLVLGNVPPSTRRFTDRVDLRMVEAEAPEPWGPMAHLTTPLAYVGNRRDFAIVRAKIDEGLLAASARLDIEHDLVARLFPFTPEYLQPGTLRGHERIVTTESGTHGWRTCAGRVRAFRYDVAGREHPADWRGKRRHGGVYLRVHLTPGEAAVVECERAPHDQRMSPDEELPRNSGMVAWPSAATPRP